MPGKLIAFIVTLLIIVTFIGFNVEHTSDIRVWFGERGLLKDVPIFVSFFVMYLVGVLSVIPFLMRWSYRKNRDRTETMPEEAEKKPEKNVRVLGGKKRKQKTEAEPEASEQSSAADEPAGEIPPEDTP